MHYPTTARYLCACLLAVSTIAIKPHSVRAQRTPAPTGLEVTGTPASATVTWQPVEGAVSYSVKRWKQDDLKCCNNSVADLPRPTWTDNGSSREGFPQPGVYVFEVTAQLKGTSGVAVINWTLPGAATPALVAVAPVSIAAAPAPTGTVAVKAPRGSPPTGIPTVNTLAGPAPQNVRVLPGGPRIHTLAWDSVPGTSGYSVYRNNPATRGEWMLANGTPILTATFPDTNILQPGAKYRVTALYSDGRQGSTDFVYANPPPLEVPTGFAAQKAAPGQVRLSWQSVAFATGYRVFGIGQPADGKLVNGTELVLSGLADGAHEWKLSADYVGAYQTANLPTAGITLYPAPTACTPPQWKPGGPMPADLFFFSGIVGGAQIQWNEVPGAVAYVIDRQLQPETAPPTRVASSCAMPGWFSRSSYTGDHWVRFRDLSGGVTPGAKYLYIVSAVGPAGEIGSIGMYWTAPDPYALENLTAKTYTSVLGQDDNVNLAWRWPQSRTPTQIPPTDFVVTAPYGLNVIVSPGGTSQGSGNMSGGCTTTHWTCWLNIFDWSSGTQLFTVTARWKASNAANALVLATKSDTVTLVKP
jgi:hypothetical protein